MYKYKYRVIKEKNLYNNTIEKLIDGKWIYVGLIPSVENIQDVLQFAHEYIRQYEKEFEEPKFKLIAEI